MNITMKYTRSILINSKLLQKFLRQERLSGVVPFLLSLKKESVRKNFYKFLSKQGYALDTKNLSPVLFHGSNTLNAILNKHRSVNAEGRREKESLVYATDDSNYAIFIAILNLKDGGAGVVAEKGRRTRLTVDLDFVNGGSKLQSGYIHIIPRSNFTPTSNREYVSCEEIEVSFAIQVEPTDLTVPIVIA